MTRKKVLLRAPVLTASGYGVHARQIARWIMTHDVDMQVQALPWGDTPWLINGDLHDGLIGHLMEQTTDPRGKLYDVTVQLQLPNEWDPQLGSFNIGITAGVETDTCNPSWVESCNKMSAVVVPSRHSEMSLRSAGNITTPIHVIPEAFPDVAASEEVPPLDIDFSTSFNFLVFGQITGNNPENDRKNIFYTIKWLCETFSNDEDVGVVVKTNAGRNTKIDRRFVEQTFAALLREVRKTAFPKIHLIHGDMTDSEVTGLYRHPKIRGLVSLTRGEGFGLPILEAAANGLPVIATGWSGHTDFLNLGKYVSIDYKLDPVHPSRVDDKIFMKGSRWAHPVEADFKRKITKFRNATTIPAEWARDLRDKVLSQNSIRAICDRYDDVFGGQF